MNIRICINLIFLIGLFLAFGLKANGSSAKEYRSFDTEEVQRMLEEDQFQYESRRAPEFNVWERLLNAIKNILEKIFGTGPSSQQIEYFIYAVALIIFIWAVIKLLGIEMNRGIVRQKAVPGAVPYHTGHEDIHSMDFERQIEEALQAKQWNMAVRLYYLLSLKRLADAGIIKVEKGKTNKEYTREIQNEEMNRSFRGLSRIFEYTWYGKFDVNETILRDVRNKTDNIYKSISS